MYTFPCNYFGQTNTLFSFDDFCVHNDKGLKNNEDAQRAFERLTCVGALARMMMLSDLGIPALVGVLEDLRELLKDSETFSISKENKKTYINRQMIGRMIKYIMEVLGYEKDETLKSNLDERTRIHDYSEYTDFGNSLIYKRKNDAECDLMVTLIKRV